MSKKLKAPEGMSELLFDESKKRAKAQNLLGDLAKLWGYSGVVTPTLEYFDLFDFTDGIPQNKLYTLTESSGKLLVLRPDSTKPIARLLCERLKILPQRLYYLQPKFVRNLAQKRRKNEIMQFGIELIGLGGSQADLEILCLAMQTLKLFGDDFVFEISHAKLWSDKNIEKLFGGEETFEEAEKYFADPESNKLLKELKNTYDILKKLFPKATIRVDFALKNDLNYYTGIIFKGYKESGEVLSGGRYDNLYSQFETNANAIGFALDVDLVASSLAIDEQENTQYIFSGDFQKDYLEAEELRKKNIVAVLQKK